MVPGDIGDVGGRHAHAAPHQPIADCGAKTAAREVAEEVAHRRSAVVRIVRLLLQLREHRVGVREQPVGQHDHVFPVVGHRIGSRGVDDQRTVMPELLLQARMAVVPVGAALDHRIAVGERLARRDPRKRDPRHAVHLERQQDAVPVDRRRLVQLVADPQGHGLPLAEPQQRRGHAAAHRHGRGRPAVDVDGRSCDHEVVLAGRGGLGTQADRVCCPRRQQAVHGGQPTRRCRRSQERSPCHAHSRLPDRNPASRQVQAHHRPHERRDARVSRRSDAENEGPRRRGPGPVVGRTPPAGWMPGQ